MLVRSRREDQLFPVRASPLLTTKSDAPHAHLRVPPLARLNILPPTDTDLKVVAQSKLSRGQPFPRRLLSEGESERFLEVEGF